MRTKTRRILVAVDGSEQAMNAVRYLSKMVTPQSTEVVLCHVVSKASESLWDRPEATDLENSSLLNPWELRQEKIMMGFFAAARTIFIEQGFSENMLVQQIHQRQQGIARDIIVEAGLGYDCVVAGRMGMNPITKHVMGSVASKLAATLTHTPLCLVGGTPSPGKVLIAIDASRETMRTVASMGRFLRDNTAQITLFHVIRNQTSATMAPWTAESAEETITELSEEELDRAKQTMAPVFEHAVESLQRAGVATERISSKIITGVLTRGGTIYAQALQGGYGTVVVGRRGLSNVERFALGRVSSKVIQLAGDTAVWIVSH